MDNLLTWKNGVKYRDVGGDLQALRDTALMFRKPGSVRSGDIVLDIGAHIGSFTFLALAAGAEKVVAVEPMPSNIEVFRANINDPRSVLLEGAVVSAEQDLIGQAALWLAAEASTDSHTMLPTAGRSCIMVDTYSLSELCFEEQPTFVKIDVEGTEYDLGIPSALTPSVDRLFLEYHFKRKDHRQKAQLLRQEVMDLGFRCLYETKWEKSRWVEGMYER